MSPPSQPRRTELDALRGVAILLVIFNHWSEVTIHLDPGGLLARLTALSWSGVDLFFVLSGFLIGGILLDNRESPTFFRTFYLRRAFRILPLYFVLLTVFYGLHSYLSQSGRWFYGPPLPWFSYLTLTQNFLMVSRPQVAFWLLPTWSLALEEHFYLTLPFLIRFVKTPWIPRFAIAACILAPVLRTILYFTIPNASAASYVLLPCRADALMLGVLVAYLGRFQPMALKRVLRPAAILLGTGCLVLSWFSPDRGSPVMMTVGYTVIALFYASVVMLVARGEFRLLQSKILASIGIRAYGLYLFHVLIIDLFRGSEPSTTLDPRAAVLSLMVLTPLVMLSWTYFEKPFIEWGHRWKYAPRSRDARTLAYVR